MKIFAKRPTELEHSLVPYTEKAEFPIFMIDELRELGYQKVFAPAEYGGFGCSEFEKGAVRWEICKIDMSLATFIGVHGLGISAVMACGSEEQKKRILPDCCNLNKIMAFAITEPEIGSDATNMKTNAVKATDGRDGYILNGEKIWIGSGTMADYVVVWAKNSSDGGQIQAFIIEKGQLGFTSEKMQGK